MSSLMNEESILTTMLFHILKILGVLGERNYKTQWNNNFGTELINSITVNDNSNLNQFLYISVQ